MRSPWWCGVGGPGRHERFPLPSYLILMAEHASRAGVIDRSGVRAIRIEDEPLQAGRESRLVRLDDDDRAVGRRAHIDDPASVFQEALLGDMQVAAQVQAGPDPVEGVEKAALAAVVPLGCQVG